ncbi:hypothetical protein AMECASPLE_036990 [Ameca splendens]|uniref:Uncharacterized protein n=1 Tax=Ameca splendens TaxID=208324 RepID=A0ABV0ZJ06_9TELE
MIRSATVVLNMIVVALGFYQLFPALSTQKPSHFSSSHSQSVNSSLFTSHVVPTQPWSDLLRSRDQNSRYQYKKNCNGNVCIARQVESSRAKLSQWKKGTTPFGGFLATSQ